MSRKVISAIAMAVLLASCSQSDKTTGPASNARVQVESDPAGASIWLDANDTGKLTPDLLRDLSTSTKHEILVKLVKDNVTYGYRVPSLQVFPDSLIKISGPLTMRCTGLGTDCQQFARRHALGSVAPATIANGQLFTSNPESSTTANGLYYPTGTSNGYIAGGLPMMAMIAGTPTHDTLSLGLYDTNYLAGRPAPEVTQSAERYSVKQSFWVVPPSNLIGQSLPTIRGIEVNEELIGLSSTNDVAFVKITYRNITNSALYQAIDPLIPAAGLTYNWVYLGFGIDPDIGAAEDDMITYDPALNMVYAYDVDFSEAVFSQGWIDKPALVGLRIIDAPADATTKVLNAWQRGSDFGGGDATERKGWSVLSGTNSFTPDFPGQQIGYSPTSPGDYRMVVAAGPITLAPGASASITVAVILATPVPGTFVSGQFVDPGNPTVADRPIAKIAANLLDKARSLVAPQ